IHVAFGDLAEWGCLPEILAKQIASRNVRDSELPTEPLRLGAFSGTGSTHEQKIETRLRRCCRWQRNRLRRRPQNPAKVLYGGKVTGTVCQGIDRLFETAGHSSNCAGSRYNEQFPNPRILRK